MLENDLRDMFQWEAEAGQPLARISFPLARKRAQALRRRRAASIGGPLVAAAAAVAIGLAAAAVPSRSHAPHPPVPAVQVAPQRFDPLTPYVTADWHPYRVRATQVMTWPTAVQILSRGGTPISGVSLYAIGGPGTNIVVYAAGQCRLTGARLSCGSAAAGTSAVATLNERAPDVGRRAAYWVTVSSAELALNGGDHSVVAFRYARGGWALVETTGNPSAVVRVAASLRYGQSSHLRFPAQLTGLPAAWREIREVGQGGAYTEQLVLGRHQGSVHNGLDTAAPDSLSLTIGPRWREYVTCTRANSCHATVINGSKVYIFSRPTGEPNLGGQIVFAPDADGVAVKISAVGPRVPLGPADVFAHHLQLLGPDQADWTTAPVSP
jgi:hypothetical protein